MHMQNTAGPGRLDCHFQLLEVVICIRNHKFGHDVLQLWLGAISKRAREAETKCAMPKVVLGNAFNPKIYNKAINPDMEPRWTDCIQSSCKDTVAGISQVGD